MLFQGEGEAFNVCRISRSRYSCLPSRAPLANRTRRRSAGSWRKCLLSRGRTSVLGYALAAPWLELDGMGRRCKCLMGSGLTRVRPQGYLPDGFVDRRWWCPGPENPDQKLDFHHFLRGCRYLRCHHGHRLLRQALSRPRDRDLHPEQPVHRICAVLGRYHGWLLQPDLRYFRGYQRKWCCSCRCIRPELVSNPFPRQTGSCVWLNGVTDL